MRASPAAKLGRSAGGWAKFWPSDRAPAMTHATLSHGPLDQTLDSLALFRDERFPLSIGLSTMPQNITREFLHQICDNLFHVDLQLLLDPVDDGELLPLVVLHPLIRDRAGLF